MGNDIPGLDSLTYLPVGRSIEEPTGESSVER